MDNAANDDSLLEVPEVMERLHIGRSKLNELVRMGSICAIKVGRRTLFERSEVRSFLERCKTVSSDARANVRGLR